MELVVQRRSRDTEANGSGSRASDAREPLEAGSVGRAELGALRAGGWPCGSEQQVESAGGQWDPVRRVWFLRRDVAERLDLLSRVVGGGG